MEDIKVDEVETIDSIDSIEPIDSINKEIKEKDTEKDNATIIKISEMVNPSFKYVWNTDKVNVLLKGGRSSTKSTVISLKLVVEFLKDDKANVFVFRKVAKYLRTSVYEQIKRAINLLGVTSQFEYVSSPLEIRHIRTGTKFYFMGADDPEKVKSTTISNGYVSMLWFEELTEFKSIDEIDTIQDTFIRADIGKPVRTYFSYNPNKNPYHWSNIWYNQIKDNPNYEINHSTYLDDELGFLSKELVEKIENYKDIDESYYRWMYLGQVVGLGSQVYNTETFQKLNEEDKINDLTYIKNDPIVEVQLSIDSGHQISATTALALGITRQNNVILLDTYYYDPSKENEKKPPSELSKDIYNFREEISLKYGMQPTYEIIDSAEGALRNQYRAYYGIRMTTSKKQKKLDMIDFVSTIFGEGRFYYIDKRENNVFIEEHRKYAYKESSIKTNRPEVIEVDDHTCDAFQYFVVTNLRRLNLRR